MTTRAKQFWAELLGEYILYGGCIATRKEVYDDAIEQGVPQKWADKYAFLRPLIDPKDYPCQPWLKDVRAAEQEAA